MSGGAEPIDHPKRKKKCGAIFWFHISLDGSRSINFSAFLFELENEQGLIFGQVTEKIKIFKVIYCCAECVLYKKFKKEEKSP